MTQPPAVEPWPETTTALRRREGRTRRSSKPLERGGGDRWTEKVGRHRRRQASVAAILDETFGRLAKCSPALWGRRAYLMLVGLVYERLALNEDEISTDELIALAKVLAENRRAEARLHEDHQPEKIVEAPDAGRGELPNHFADVVRQIYGTNLQTAESTQKHQDCQMSNG